MRSLRTCTPAINRLRKAGSIHPGGCPGTQERYGAMRTLVGLVLGSGLLFAVPAPLAAQTATRTQISGRVVDAQRGALPGAMVQLRDQETNQTRSLTADAQGQFTFANLHPLTYELPVTLDQSNTSVIKDIRPEG